MDISYGFVTWYLRIGDLSRSYDQIIEHDRPKKMWQPNIATGPSHRDPTSISWTIKTNYDLYCLYSGHYSWPKAAGIHDWRALAEISRRRTSSRAYLTRPAKCGLKMEKWQLKWQYATKCHQPKMNYFVAWFAPQELTSSSGVSVTTFRDKLDWFSTMLPDCSTR